MLAFSASPLLRGKISSAGPDPRCLNSRNGGKEKETLRFTEAKVIFTIKS